MNHRSARGVTTILVLGFMGIFLLILASVTSYALEQATFGRALYGREQALQIAEAGLEYYRWYLAHNPNDLTNGTGGTGPFPYEVDDPEGAALGSASLTISGNTQCGIVQSVDISSKGTSNFAPEFPRTISARYMRKSVAAYSYLLNSNVWAGSDRTITGPYFSNGGIRMDGTNNSDVSSAAATWSCDSSYGCSPTTNEPGVFGVGSGSALWKYPVSTVDFAAISVNLANLKTYAQSSGGIYYGAATGSTTQRGYHLVFKSNGTVDIYRVSKTTSVPSYSDEHGWMTEYSIINQQSLLGNFAIPGSCSVIFVEDRAWIDGVVSGKVTVAAATPSDTSTSPTVYLDGNITYATNDGTSGLTVIAEDDISISLNVPDSMEIHGIFVAENGAYGRNFYTNSSSYPSSERVGSSWSSYVTRSQLKTVGTVVSNLRTGTSWKCGGSTCSGFLTRIDAYDLLQADNPPPFTPFATADFRFVSWREK